MLSILSSECAEKVALMRQLFALKRFMRVWFHPLHWTNFPAPLNSFFSGEEFVPLLQIVFYGELVTLARQV